MNRRNYQKELEAELSNIEKEGRAPTLFLHSCCAPCSSYVLEYLSRYFTITVFYYNPNISPASEYEERAREQERLIREMETVHPVRFLCGEYRPELFYEAVKGLEQEPEGGARCTECFKDAERLNRIGEEAGARYGVRFLNSDFKKRNGYKRSTELSREYGLYRQDYCGCVFSRRQAKP